MLIGKQFSTSQFSFKKDTFSAEANQVRGFLGRLYDDALDIGFTIKSSVTGAVVPFYLDSEIKDADGDIIVWNFKAVHPKFSHLKAVIFND